MYQVGIKDDISGTAPLYVILQAFWPQILWANALRTHDLTLVILVLPGVYPHSEGASIRSRPSAQASKNMPLGLKYLLNPLCLRTINGILLESAV